MASDTPIDTTNEEINQLEWKPLSSDLFRVDMIDEKTIIPWSDIFDQHQLGELLHFLDDYYHNAQSLVSDVIYDKILSMYTHKFGPYQHIGSSPRCPSGKMTELPFYLGSLRKLKENDEVVNWVSKYKGPYLVEDKIDGLTLLLVHQTQSPSKLFTRGKGYRGIDVSHLSPYLKLPNVNENVSIRGEVVMTRDSYNKVGGEYKNARNMVSGIVNSKDSFNPILASELKFYAYRIMDSLDKPSIQTNILQKWGFLTPNPILTSTITKDTLTVHLSQREDQALYEIDGLVVYNDEHENYPDGDDPRHVMAFKMDTEIVETMVTEVVWNASKDMLLKPIVHYKSVYLSGADLSKASGYNAQFIINNHIGPGAVIRLTRSGGVIPRILSVVSPAPNGGQLPEIIHGAYTWNENKVEFVLLEATSQVAVKRLSHFLTTIGVQHFGPARVQTLVEAGIDTIDALLRLKPQMITGLPGIGQIISEQLCSDIKIKTTGMSLSCLMTASGFFSGIGQKRFDVILQTYPALLQYVNHPDMVHYLCLVPGFSQALAKVIGEGLINLVKWLYNNPSITYEVKSKTLNNSIAASSGSIDTQSGYHLDQTMLGVNVVFSGFRNQTLNEKIVSRGGLVGLGVSKNTNLVVVKDMSKLTNKVKDAQTRGIKVVDLNEFTHFYQISI